MGKQIKITAAPGVSELVIRKGEALAARAPKSINIVGILSAPFQFILGKTALIKDNLVECHLLIFKDLGKLELHVKDTDPYTEHVIVGKLSRDKAAELFRINSDKRWTVSEFLKFIRTVKYYFAEPSEQAALIESLQKWNAKIETVIKEHNDQSGNSLAMLEKKVGDVSLKRTFKLNIPIYQGFDKQTFSVEIGLDPKNTAVELYLISDELFELEAKFRESLIDKAIAEFDSWAFSKIQVS